MGFQEAWLYISRNSGFPSFAGMIRLIFKKLGLVSWRQTEVFSRMLWKIIRCKRKSYFWILLCSTIVVLQSTQRTGDCPDNIPCYLPLVEECVMKNNDGKCPEERIEGLLASDKEIMKVNMFTFYCKSFTNMHDIVLF